MNIRRALPFPLAEKGAKPAGASGPKALGTIELSRFNRKSSGASKRSALSCPLRCRRRMSRNIVRSPSQAKSQVNPSKPTSLVGEISRPPTCRQSRISFPPPRWWRSRKPQSAAATRKVTSFSRLPKPRLPNNRLEINAAARLEVCLPIRPTPGRGAGKAAGMIAPFEPRNRKRVVLPLGREIKIPRFVSVAHDLAAS